jgi:RecA/RadA recombinase
MAKQKIEDIKKEALNTADKVIDLATDALSIEEQKELQKKIEARRKITSERAKRSGGNPEYVLVGGEKEDNVFIPTGIYELDAILTDAACIDNVGIPRGKVIEILGPSMSGKTWLCTQIMKAYQSLGERILYVDAENTFYDVRFNQLGVNTSNPDLWEYISFPSAEANGMYILDALESGEYGAVFLDSITALVPELELTKDLADNQKIGAHAMFVNRFLKRSLPRAKKTGTSLYFINQKRIGAGAMPGTMVEKSGGGAGVEFFTHIRLWMKALGGAAGQVIDEETGEIIGGRSEITIKKSRYHRNGMTATVTIPFVEGNSNPITDFINRIMNNKKLETHVVTQRKVYKYFDPLDVGLKEPLAQSKDKVEFINKLKELPAPAKLKKGDTTSKTAYDYLTFVLQMNERDKKLLELSLDEGEPVEVDVELPVSSNSFYDDDADIRVEVDVD